MFEYNEFHLCSHCQKSEHINALYFIGDKPYCPACVLDGRETELITKCEFAKAELLQRRCKHYKKASQFDRCMYLKNQWICDKLVKQ